MIYVPAFISIIEVLLVAVPTLLTVAFVTVAERKTMASMQRRLGPNIVGYYGLLQAFADALKLLLKEYVSPTQANIALFFIGPVITLIFSLLGYAVIPYGPGLTAWDYGLGIIYMLAVSSISTYGILLAGWSANSKYAFLGSLRSTAQLISYELILSSAILIVILLTGTLSLTLNIEAQRMIWFVIPLFPVFIIFFIGSVAETNRAPFDLAEAESELVSGFMTEHAAVIFVFFFLAEYASILLICILNSVLFFGGYLDLRIINDIYYFTCAGFDIFLFLFDEFIECVIMISGFLIKYLTSLTDMHIDCHVSQESGEMFYQHHNGYHHENNNEHINVRNVYVSDFSNYSSLKEYALNLKQTLGELGDTNNSYSMLKYAGYSVLQSLTEGLSSGLNLALKSSLMVFIFIWVRASFPRIRFDQLMSFSWTVLLPIIIAFIVLIPCINYSFDMIPTNTPLL